MNAQPIEATNNVIDISSRNIELTSRKEARPHGQPIIANVIKDEDEFKSHAADAITDKNKLNDIILEAYLNGDISKITAFIFGINTGFRVSDILDIRVQDISTDGKVDDWYAVREQKTGKPRQIWLNDTVKKALEFLIEHKGLQPQDYLFVADKQKHLWKYVDLNNSKYLETGKPDDARVDYEYDTHGNRLPYAPTRTRNLNEYFKNIALKCGVDKHCSTHCMRKTFSYWFEITIPDEEVQELRNKFGNIEDKFLIMLIQQSSKMLSDILNHSSQATTDKYYKAKKDKLIKGRTLMLNLGAEAVEMFIEEYK